MGRLLFILLACSVGAARAGASDIYYAGTAQGSNDGTSCANAYAYNDAANGWNQPTPQTAGNTLHICATITGTANQTILTATDSGTSMDRCSPVNFLMLVKKTARKIMRALAIKR